jgi:hypothetical protein
MRAACALTHLSFVASVQSQNHINMASNAPLLSALVDLAKDEHAGRKSLVENTGEDNRRRAVATIGIISGSASTAKILLGADIIPTMMDVVRKDKSGTFGARLMMYMDGKAGFVDGKWAEGNTIEGWALIFLMNIAQAAEAVPVLRVNNIYDLLAPLATQDHTNAIMACAALSFVVGGEENGERPLPPLPPPSSFPTRSP